MHSFYKYVIDPEKLVKAETLSGFNKELIKQSNTEEAVKRYNVLNTVSDNEYGKYKSPLYFGAGGEFLSHTFFDFFGGDYNLVGISSVDDWDNPKRDIGIDQEAVSQKRKTYKKQSVVSQPGSPIDIQVKWTDNKVKQYTTNDGSRIMNFVGAGLARACKNATAYNTRLILFTAGKGLHYRLDANTSNRIEVINNIEISKKIDNNPFFWNHMRKFFGIPTKTVDFPMDPEGNAIKMELEKA